MNADPSFDLTVTHAIPAAPEPIYDAFLDPGLAGRFMFTTPAGRMARVEIDGRVGGRFCIVEQRGDQLAEHFGAYLALDRPGRLAFSFMTERDDPAPSRVDIAIAPEAGGSMVTLTHVMDPRWAAYGDRIRQGWTRMLDELAATLATR